MTGDDALVTTYATLWDWRRRVAELYAELRRTADPEAAWRLWRAERDRLFATHPQTPLDPDRRAGFAGLDLFPYDPGFRFEVDLEAPDDCSPVAAPAGADGEVGLFPFARTRGLAGALGGELALYWIAGYGGGVFLPFRDATGGARTSPAGAPPRHDQGSGPRGPGRPGRARLQLRL